MFFQYTTTVGICFIICEIKRNYLCVL